MNLIDVKEDTIATQLLRQIVQNNEFHNKMSFYLQNQISIKSLLLQLLEKIPEELILGISIFDSFGKIIESTGSILGQYSTEITFGQNNQFKARYSISRKENKQLNILLIGFSKCGKSSIIHRLNYNAFLGTKLHNIGISTSQFYFLGKKLKITEIGGNMDLISYYLNEKVKNNFDAIFFVLDYGFIYKESLYERIFAILKKIEDKNNLTISFILTKSDIKNTTKNFERINKKLEEILFSQKNLFIYSSLTNNNFKSIIEHIKAL